MEDIYSEKENNKEYEVLSACTLCPRTCKTDRLGGKAGYCGQTAEIRAARAALHFWEEPVISGYPADGKVPGSGAVFFSGCNLRCVYCQNHDIALGKAGKIITPERLPEIFFELKDKGALNINLVTGTPFIPQIRTAIESARSRGFDLPFIFNCGGYESVDALKMLDGLIDVYLPDMKYHSPEIAARYSNAPDYFEKASLAIAEMYRQTGPCEFYTRNSDASDAPSEDLLIKRGVIVRHLVLPGLVGESKRILRYLHETYGDNIYISIMNQYTPMPQITNGCLSCCQSSRSSNRSASRSADGSSDSSAGCATECAASDGTSGTFPELARKVTAEEYERVTDFALKIGIEKAFIQEGETAEESFIPEFNYEGL